MQARRSYSKDSMIATWLSLASMSRSFGISDLDELESLYETRVRLVLSDLDALVDEIYHLIEQIPDMQTLIDATIAVKFYVIAWNTLSDVIAKLINIVFDLGIDDKDIGLMMILRNTHVKDHGLDELVSKHKSDLRNDHFARLRNDIVHRGILSDSDLQVIRKGLTRVTLLRILANDEAAESSAIALDADLKQYLVNKQTEFSQHMQATIALLNEVVDAMVPVVVAKIKLANDNEHLQKDVLSE